MVIRLGRVLPQPRGPGIVLLFPPVDRMVRVSLRETGVAETDLNPEGKVKVRGELWDAVSAAPLRRGRRVKLVGLDGLKLRVIPSEDAG